MQPEIWYPALTSIQDSAYCHQIINFSPSAGNLKTSSSWFHTMGAGEIQLWMIISLCLIHGKLVSTLPYITPHSITPHFLWICMCWAGHCTKSHLVSLSVSLCLSLYIYHYNISLYCPCCCILTPCTQWVLIMLFLVWSVPARRIPEKALQGITEEL